ncbi:hypothetical protein [uncultured Enterococcus sp.]|uniref:hypothetical protein n=1 Tax=uncultured Enterococcus sp. TaxID=167972 RepID=UPI002AA7F8BD|nr:hypothetical protein [uncultured Enterococcus sp.]
MRKRIFLKVSSLMIVGATSLVLGATSANAASFEDMKEHVESGEGQIYNPISNEIMDEEKSLEYVQYIEEAVENPDSEEIPEETQIAAFIETKSDNPVQLQENALFPPKMTRGAKPPTSKPVVVDDFARPYQSNTFSGSGWRFSGMRFTVRNVSKNPYFGVRATLDTFTFFNGMHDVFVPVSNTFVYTISNFRGTPLDGYFATWNPVSGSRYYIY